MRPHPLRKGFVPSVKIAGRYLAKASTDKQNIDLSVNVRRFVNISKAMARLSTAQLFGSRAFFKRSTTQKGTAAGFAAVPVNFPWGELAQAVSRQDLPAGRHR
jgi:hypothetical protein